MRVCVGVCVMCVCLVSRVTEVINPTILWNDVTYDADALCGSTISSSDERELSTIELIHVKLP